MASGPFDVPGPTLTASEKNNIWAQREGKGRDGCCTLASYCAPRAERGGPLQLRQGVHCPVFKHTRLRRLDLEGLPASRRGHVDDPGEVDFVVFTRAAAHNLKSREAKRQAQRLLSARAYPSPRLTGSFEAGSCQTRGGRKSQYRKNVDDMLPLSFLYSFAQFLRAHSP